MIVSDKIISEAYTNFVELYHPQQTGKGYYFWKFIGADKGDNVRADGKWDLPPEAARRAEALAGPYWRAVAKAMQHNGADPFTTIE